MNLAIMEALDRLVDALEGTPHEADMAILNRAMNPKDGSGQLRLTGYLAFAFKEAPAPRLELPAEADEARVAELERTHSDALAEWEGGRARDTEALQAIRQVVDGRLKDICVDLARQFPDNPTASTHWVSFGDNREPAA